MKKEYKNSFKLFIYTNDLQVLLDMAFDLAWCFCVPSCQISHWMEWMLILKMFPMFVSLPQTLRIQSPEGTKRIDVHPSDPILEVFEKVSA